MELPHLVTLSIVRMHHRGLLDRLIIAQAVSEGVPVITTELALDVPRRPSFGFQKGPTPSRDRPLVGQGGTVGVPRAPALAPPDRGRDDRNCPVTYTGRRPCTTESRNAPA